MKFPKIKLDLSFWMNPVELEIKNISNGYLIGGNIYAKDKEAVKEAICDYIDKNISSLNNKVS